MKKLETLTNLYERQVITFALKNIRADLTKLKENERVKSYIAKSEEEMKLIEKLHEVDTELISKTKRRA